MDKTALCPFSSTQHVDQHWAVGPHASPPRSGHLVKGPPLVPPLRATLSKLLDASCLLAQALGPSFGRLVTAVGPFVPAFLCLPTLCLGKWESQPVCCVNTSWNPVIESLRPPATRAPGGLVPPWAFGVGWQVGSSPPMTQPLTHRTARPRLGRGLEPARTAPGREGSGRASTASPWHGFRNFLAEAAVKPLKTKFLAPPHSPCKIPLTL